MAKKKKEDEPAGDFRCGDFGGRTKAGGPCKRPVKNGLCSAHRPKGEELNDRQWAFCQEYLLDLNGRQAAIRAGYSEKAAEQQASFLLINPKVQAAIQKLKAERAARTRISSDRVLEELAKIGFSDIRELMQWNDERGWFIPSDLLTDEQAAAVAEVTSETVTTTQGRGEDAEVTRRHKMRIKTWDKLTALEKIAKHLGIFAAHEVHHSGRVETTAPQVHIYLPDNGRHGAQDARRVAQEAMAASNRISGNGGG